MFWRLWWPSVGVSWWLERRLWWTYSFKYFSGRLLHSIGVALRPKGPTGKDYTLSRHVSIVGWELIIEYPLVIARKLRSQVYRNLCLWIAASRSACGLTKCADVLFTQMLSDIVVHRRTIQLLTGTIGWRDGSWLFRWVCYDFDRFFSIANDGVLPSKADALSDSFLTLSLSCCDLIF